MLSLAAGLFLWLATGATGWAAEATAKILVQDQLVRPDRPDQLTVRLVKAGLLASPLGGEQLEVSVDGQPRGTVLTGGDGRALVQLSGMSPGLYRVSVTLRSTRYDAETTEGWLAAWQPGSQLLVVSLEGIFRRRFALPFFSLMPREPPAGAIPALSKLADRYRLVYLTTRSGQRREALRAWLNQHQFPQAPLLVWSDPQAGMEASVEVLEDLRARGWQPVVGIGGSVVEAEVFLEAGLRAVILSTVELDLPEDAVEADDWPSVLDALS